MIDKTFIDTITLYNHYSTDENGKTVHKWGRIVLHNCYFGKVASDSSSNLTKTNADEFICRIPYSPNFKSLYLGEENTFSLHENDIIINGVVEDKISDIKGHRPADILRKYKDDAFEVKSFSVNTHLPYTPHYRASGV